MYEVFCKQLSFLLLFSLLLVVCCLIIIHGGQHGLTSEAGGRFVVLGWCGGEERDGLLTVQL